MCIFIIILLYASITVFQRKPVSRRSYYGKTRVFRVILLLPIEIGRIIFLPIDRCGEGDGAGDVEVVGESAAVYLFRQAVVAGREVEQADMAIDGGGAVGGYGAQDGGEAEVLGEWNLLPVTVSLAFDGVLLSVVHIVVVGIDDPRLHHRVASRDAFVNDDHTQSVRTGHGLGAVRRLSCIYQRLPCRWAARGECEGGNQEEEKFCLFHRVRLLPQFAFALKVLGEGFPLQGVLLNVCLCALVVDELRRVAVVQVVAGIVLVLADGGIVQNKVVEDAAVEIRNETADLEQEVLTKAELQPLFVIGLHQFLEKLFILLLKADFASADVEPLDVVLGEEGIDSGAPCLAVHLASKELDQLLGTDGKGHFLIVVIAAARGEGEHDSGHHEDVSPEFHCFHIHFFLFYLLKSCKFFILILNIALLHRPVPCWLVV